MENNSYCLLHKSFYENEAMEIPEISNKENRVYLYINIYYKGLYYLIPFYSKIKNPPAGHYLIPSETRPNAGLNFEKVIILKDNKHIIELENPQMATTQKQRVEDRSQAIENKFKTYINTFIRKCNNEKIDINEDKNYRYSTLHHYKDLLL